LEEIAAPIVNNFDILLPENSEN